MNETEEQPKREGAGGVFGVALGLSLFALATMVVVFSKTAPLESPAIVWAKHFQGSEGVSGFEFSGAALLPGNREVVRFRRIGAPPIDEELAPVAEALSEDVDGTDVLLEEVQDPEGGLAKGLEWSDIVEGERGLAPDDLVFVFYPPEASGEMFATYFQDLPRRGMRGLEPTGGTVIVESGELEWGVFSTNYVRQRQYEALAGLPRFIDSLRVNLSVGQSCVLVAIWPAGVPSGVEPVEALLKEVVPVPDSGS